jgi:hypothetical protein
MMEILVNLLYDGDFGSLCKLIVGKIQNTGSLFYLTNILCHLMRQLRCVGAASGMGDYSWAHRKR